MIQPNSTAQKSLIVIAWATTLLVSALGDIICFELTGSVPLWPLWAKVGLLGILIASGWLWKPIRALRPFFIILLAITTLMRVNGWLLELTAWNTWQAQQSFAVVTLTAQGFEVIVALLLIGVLFLLRKRREAFFLIRGEMNAMTGPYKLLGEKAPGPLWRFGLVFTIFVILAQFFMFIMPNLANLIVPRLLPLIPVILLLAALNGFTEEIILRTAPIAPVFEVVGKSNAMWMAAVIFGLAHYIGGIPSGISGVLITALLGWFFGRCMLDSKGFFWPWLFHSIQDILPFTLMALAALS